jgi:hypothetical protein
MFFVADEENHIDFSYEGIAYVQPVQEPANSFPDCKDFLDGIEIVYVGGARIFLEGWDWKRWKAVKAQIATIQQQQQAQAQSRIVNPNQLKLV